MKVLSRHEADVILAPIAIKIGQWNELTDIASDKQTAYVSLKAPKVAIELYVASLWLVDWLPKGKWKLVQIDNSTSPGRDESLLFGRLMNSPIGEWDVAMQRTFLLEFDDDMASRQKVDIVIAGVVFFALMFQWHIHVVSDGGSSGQRLSIQDGFIYCFGNEENITVANSLFEQVRLNPLATPRWIEPA